MSTAEEPPSGRIEVLSGGSLSAEELAAVVVALTPGSPDDGEVAAPAWARAGMLEATGHRGFTSAPDLEGYAFDL